MKRADWFALLCAVVGVAALVWALTANAHAHEWYRTTSNPVTGYSCCGGLDCIAVTYEQFSETKDAYVVNVDPVMAAFLRQKPGRYSIPKSQALPARGWKKGETGYHACVWGGALKCFFFPAGS